MLLPQMDKMQTFLWFDGQAEQAVEFYRSTFEGLRVGDILRYGPDMPYPEESVLTIQFDFFGQSFVAMNSGPTVYAKQWTLCRPSPQAFSKAQMT